MPNGQQRDPQLTDAEIQELNALIEGGEEVRPSVAYDPQKGYGESDPHVQDFSELGLSTEELRELFNTEEEDPYEVDYFAGTQANSVEGQEINLEDIDLDDEEADYPDFLNYLPEELQGEALSIYNKKGFDGVREFLQQKSIEDEEYENTLKDVPLPVLGLLGFDKEDAKNFGDAFDNFFLTIQQAYPNVNLATGRLFRSIFGEETIDRWVERHGEDSFLTDGLSRADQIEALRNIQTLQAQHKDTSAIVSSALDGNFAESLTGIITAPLSFASTIVNVAQTFGAGLYTDMFADTYLSVNEARAEERGVTIEDLINEGDDAVAGPASFATVMTALEGIGLGRVGKYLVKSTPGPIKKKIINWLLANTVEGTTEILQTGVGEAAVAWEKSGGDAAVAAEAFIDGVFSKEGAESFALGFFASGGSTIVGKPIANAVAKRRENAEEIAAVHAEIAEIEEGLRSNPNISSENRVKFENTIDILKAKGEELVKEGYREIINVDDKGVTELNKIGDEISLLHDEITSIEEDVNITETEKNIQIGAINDLIISKVNRTTQIITDSNESKKEADKKRVADAKEAANDPNDGKNVQDVAKKEQEKIDKENQEDYDDPIGATARRERAQLEIKRELDIAKIEENSELSQEQKDEQIAELGGFDQTVKTPAGQSVNNIPVEEFQKPFDPRQTLPVNHPFVRNIVEPIEKFFGDKVDIVFKPGAEVGAFGKVEKIDGKVTISYATGRPVAGSSIEKTGVKLDTLLHEPGHILYQLAENSKDPELKAIFNRLEKLIPTTKEYKEISNNPAYQKLSEAGKRQEAFSRYFGVNAVSKISPDTAFGKAVQTLIEYVNEKFGLRINPQSLTLEDISDLFLADLLLDSPTLFNIEGDAISEAFDNSREDAFLDAFYVEAAGEVEIDRYNKLRKENSGPDNNFKWKNAKRNIERTIVAEEKAKITENLDARIEEINNEINEGQEEGIEGLSKKELSDRLEGLDASKKSLYLERNALLKAEFPKDWFKRVKYLDLIDKEINKIQAKIEFKSSPKKLKTISTLEGKKDRLSKLKAIEQKQHEAEILDLEREIKVLEILSKRPDLPEKDSPNYDRVKGHRRIWDYTAEVQNRLLLPKYKDKDFSKLVRDNNLNMYDISSATLKNIISRPNRLNSGSSISVGEQIITDQMLPEGTFDVIDGNIVANEEGQLLRYELGDFLIDTFISQGPIDLVVGEEDKGAPIIKVSGKKAWSDIKLASGFDKAKLAEHRYAIIKGDKVKPGKGIHRRHEDFEWSDGAKEQLKQANETESYIDLVLWNKYLKDRETNPLLRYDSKNYTESENELRADDLDFLAGEINRVGNNIYTLDHYMHPHGRMSPETVGLNYQNDKLVRSLERFTESEILTDEGLDALLVEVHVAVTNSKGKFSEKLAEAKNKKEEYLSWLDDEATLQEELKKSKEPYALRSALETLKMVTEDRNAKVGLGIALDAKNSVLQMWTILTGSQAIADKIDLGPEGLEPQDANKYINKDIIRKYGKEASDSRSEVEKKAHKKNYDKVNSELKDVVDKFYKETLKDKAADVSESDRLRGEELTFKQRGKLKDLIEGYKKENSTEVLLASEEFARQPDVQSEIRDITKKATLPKVYGGGLEVMAKAIFDNFKTYPGEFKNINILYSDFLADAVKTGFENTFSDAVKGKGIVEMAMTKLNHAKLPAKIIGVINQFMTILDKKVPNAPRITTPYSGRNTDSIGDIDNNKKNKVTLGNSDIRLNLENLTAIAAIIIQGMDSQMSAWMYKQAKKNGYPLKQVYDAFITTPNHVFQMKRDYQEGIQHMKSVLSLEKIVDQLTEPLDINGKDVINEFNDYEKVKALKKKIRSTHAIGKRGQILKSFKTVPRAWSGFSYSQLVKVSEQELTKGEIEGAIYKKGTWTGDQALQNERNFEDSFGHPEEESGEVFETRDVYSFAPVPETKITKGNKKKLVRNVHQLLNLRNANFKSNSPYKKSKITDNVRQQIIEYKKEFASNKDSWSYDEFVNFSLKVANTYKEGRIAQKDKREQLESTRESIKEQAAKAVKDLTGINQEEFKSPDRVKTEWQKNRKLINQLKAKGPLGLLADTLMTLSLDDFFGLIIRTLPKNSKARKIMQKIQEDVLVEPLKIAEYQHNEYHANIIENNKGLKKAYKITDRFLGKHSEIEVDGQKKTNSQVVLLYNYIKDPRLHNQLIDGGVTFEKMAEIIKYVKSQENFKSYSDSFPSTFEQFESTINGKLDEHGYSGVSRSVIPTEEDAINVDEIDADNVSKSYQMLREVYDGQIPTVAPYIPFKGKGTKDVLNIEESVLGDTSGNFYSVMTSNLRQRTYTGSVDVTGQSVDSVVDSYAQGPLRTVAYLDFAKNATAYFNSESLSGFEAALGPNWKRNMTNSIKRIITGRIENKNQPPFVKTLDKWFARSVGAIMSVNPRSAILQLVSIPNFGFDNPVEYVKYAGFNAKNRESLKLIRGTGFMSVRGKGGTDVILDQLFTQTEENAIAKAIDTLGQKGYFLTKAADKFSISHGGAPYLSWRLDVHRANPKLSEEQAIEKAMIEFVGKANEAQQSVNQSRLGNAQTLGIGKYLLTFLNSPIQFNRKIAKSLKEIQAGNSIGKNFTNITAILSLQYALFSFLQKAMANAFDDDESDDEEDKKKFDNFLVGMAQTMAKSSGLGGSAVSLGIDLLNKNEKIYKNDKVQYGAYQEIIESVINTPPSVSAKFRLIKNTLRSPYKQSDGFIDESEFITRLASAIEISGIPTARVLKILNSVNDLGANDLEILEKIMRLGGWSRYDLQKQLGKIEE